MYQIEKISETSFYIKATGTFPPPVAEKFVKEYEELTKDIQDKLSIIVDITDAILLSIDSVEIILELLKKNNERIFRSAFIIAKNPPLSEEFKYLIDRDGPMEIEYGQNDSLIRWSGIIIPSITGKIYANDRVMKTFEWDGSEEDFDLNSLKPGGYNISFQLFDSGELVFFDKILINNTRNIFRSSPGRAE